MRTSLRTVFALAAISAASAASAQNRLENPGFETLCTISEGWNKFGNVQLINFYTTSGTHSIKMFGPFCCAGGFGYSGIFQDVPAAAGSSWRANANVLSPCWDRLRNANAGPGTQAFVEIQFFDEFGNQLEPAQAHISPKQQESTVVGGNATCDAPNPPEPSPINLQTDTAVAPDFTHHARIVLLVEQFDFVGGAAWWDDAFLERSDAPGVNQLINPSFEISQEGCGNSPYQHWVNFGNGQANAGENTRNGTFAAKLYGGYNGDPAYSGWFEDVPAVAGEQLIGRGWARSSPTDSLASGNDVHIQIEFYDEFGNNLVGAAAVSPSVPTPGDGTYRLYETGVAVAPDGTAIARFVVIQIQHGYVGGATWWDDCELTAACGADFNGDGFLDFFDADAFVACFEGAECPPGRNSDYNGDGFADFFDYDDFVLDFEAGC